jgi:hypothetical protein
MCTHSPGEAPGEPLYQLNNELTNADVAREMKRAATHVYREGIREIFRDLKAFQGANWERSEAERKARST